MYTLQQYHTLVQNGFQDVDHQKLRDTLTLNFMDKYEKYLKQHKPKKDYRYLVTFTLDTKKTLPEDDVVEGYIISQFVDRDALKVIEAHIVKEKTQQNISHWHVAVSTAKCLKKDRFNYYIKKYGNIDISGTKAQTLNEALNYINKDNTSKQIV